MKANPCPWPGCGGEASVTRLRDGGGSYVVECNNGHCEARGPARQSRQDAIAAWNALSPEWRDHPDKPGWWWLYPTGWLDKLWERQKVEMIRVERGSDGLYYSRPGSTHCLQVTDVDTPGLWSPAHVPAPPEVK